PIQRGRVVPLGSAPDGDISAEGKATGHEVLQRRLHVHLGETIAIPARARAGEARRAADQNRALIDGVRLGGQQWRREDEQGEGEEETKGWVHVEVPLRTVRTRVRVSDAPKVGAGPMGDNREDARYRSSRRSSCALMATITVLADIR